MPVAFTAFKRMQFQKGPVIWITNDRIFFGTVFQNTPKWYTNVTPLDTVVSKTEKRVVFINVCRCGIYGHILSIIQASDQRKDSQVSIIIVRRNTGRDYFQIRSSSVCVA